jgi:hypothetical protein
VQQKIGLLSFADFHYLLPAASASLLAANELFQARYYYRRRF